MNTKFLSTWFSLNSVNYPTECVLCVSWLKSRCRQNRWELHRRLQWDYTCAAVLYAPPRRGSSSSQNPRIFLWTRVVQTNSVFLSISAPPSLGTVVSTPCRCGGRGLSDHPTPRDEAGAIMQGAWDCIQRHSCIPLRLPTNTTGDDRF